MTRAARANLWYEAHAAELSRMWGSHAIRLNEVNDPVKGACNIEFESAKVIASVTFWNKGDVSFIYLDLPHNDQDPVVADDRKTSPEESVEGLLDSYLAVLLARLNR